MNAHSRIFEPSKDKQSFHLVECQHGPDPVFDETTRFFSEADCVAEIIDGQFENIIRIIAVNIEDGTARDVSEDIARLIAQINPERCSDEAIALCSKYDCLTWQMGTA